MSYMRGQDYVFISGSSDDTVNIWSDRPSYHVSAIWAEGRKNPNGIAMPLKKFEELLVMMYAEMSPAQIKRAQQRALKQWRGNYGCEALEALSNQSGTKVTDQSVAKSNPPKGTQ